MRFNVTVYGRTETGRMGAAPKMLSTQYCYYLYIVLCATQILMSELFYQTRAGD